MKISQRLNLIESMVNNRYEHIWDCCCDHGLLGAKLLDNDRASVVHFVDVVPDLMREVSNKLERFYPAADGKEHRWQVHCIDVALLPLVKRTNSQLIIIAGVGGELLISLVDAIIAAHPLQQLEFILCPVHHIYEVRKALKNLGLGLIDERLLEENRRFYEVLHVSTHSKVPISLVGSQMWDLTRTLDQRYLQKTLSHYQRIESGQLSRRISTTTSVTDVSAEDVSNIIKQYQALTLDKK